jgi:hypothetical protein
MVFYKTLPTGEAKLEIGRVLFALIIILGFGVLALIAHIVNWPEGSSAFLHLTEFTTGGVVGALFVEKAK